MLYIRGAMKTDASALNQTSAPDQRSRNRLVIGLMSFVSGTVIHFTGKFLTNYDGPLAIRIALVLGPWALVGVLAVFCRGLYQADELEVLINREALAFAFYGALIGLFVLNQLQSAGFVADFAWTTKRLIGSLVLLMVAGTFWSKRRYR